MREVDAAKSASANVDFKIQMERRHDKGRSADGKDITVEASTLANQRIQDDKFQAPIPSCLLPVFPSVAVPHRTVA